MLPYITDTGNDDADWYSAMRCAFFQLGPDTFTRTPEAFDRPLSGLIACEESARVRDAFRARGFDAWSCDVLPTAGDPRWHIQGDVLEVLSEGWDFMIAFPPCTHLAVSGARWFAEKRDEQAAALDFVRALLDAPIRHIALENPVSIISSHIRKPDMTFQPWQFGHGEVKRTCLWLKNLPKLRPTSIVDGREARVHRMPPGPNRARDRSRTFTGVAEAMAVQWGDYIRQVSPDTFHNGAGSFSNADEAPGPVSIPPHDNPSSEKGPHNHGA